MKVHLPSGRVVVVAPSVAAKAEIMADLCPRRDEHTPRRNQRNYRPVVHSFCGLPVIWVSKKTGLRG